MKTNRETHRTNLKENNT